MSADSAFSNEYIQEQSVTTLGETETPEPQTAENVVQAALSEYEVGKPRRVVIRVRLAK